MRTALQVARWAYGQAEAASGSLTRAGGQARGDVGDAVMHHADARGRIALPHQEIRHRLGHRDDPVGVKEHVLRTA